MDNKDIFARNLKRIMEQKGVTRTDISEALGISYFTVSDWVKGKKYPRMDKVELLARYFGISMSDLIELPTNTPTNDEIVLTDGERMIVQLLRRLPEDKQKMAIQMLRVALADE